MLMLGCPTRRCYVWGFWNGAMPKGLKRYYGQGHLHFLTFSWRVARTRFREVFFLRGLRSSWKIYHVHR